MPAARATRRTSSKTSVSARRPGTCAEHDGDVAAGRPAEGARAREHRLVGLAAQHGVDDERLEPGVPGAADLGGAGVDLGGGEGDLAGVAQHRGVDVDGVVGIDDVVDVALDHLDGQLHQVDGLLQVDHAGQRPRSGAEDGGGQRGAGRDRLAGVGVPVHEPWMPACTISAHPGAVLGAQLAEPREVGVHPRRGGGAERPGGAGAGRCRAARSGRGAGRGLDVVTITRLVECQGNAESRTRVSGVLNGPSLIESQDVHERRVRMAASRSTRSSTSRSTVIAARS